MQDAGTPLVLWHHNTTPCQEVLETCCFAFALDNTLIDLRVKGGCPVSCTFLCSCGVGVLFPVQKQFQVAQTELVSAMPPRERRALGRWFPEPMDGQSGAVCSVTSGLAHGDHRVRRVVVEGDSHVSITAPHPINTTVFSGTPSSQPACSLHATPPPPHRAVVECGDRETLGDNAYDLEGSCSPTQMSVGEASHVCLHEDLASGPSACDFSCGLVVIFCSTMQVRRSSWRGAWAYELVSGRTRQVIRATSQLVVCPSSGMQVPCQVRPPCYIVTANGPIFILHGRK